MGFKLKSGNKVDFKMMGSSPVRNMKDGDYSQSFEKPGPPNATEFKHSWDGVDESKDATSLIQAKKEEQDAVNDAAEGKAFDKMLRVMLRLKKILEAVLELNLKQLLINTKKEVILKKEIKNGTKQTRLEILALDI